MKVQGVIDGARYDVQVDKGGVQGSALVARLVQQYTGRAVKAGPTGPMVAVSPTDPRTVLALLVDKTRVERVEGADEALPATTRRPGVVR